MTQDEFIKLCVEGDYTQISDAIHSGIDPNIEGKLMGNPMLPIFAAVSSGNKDAVQALAENGADCANGFTAAVISKSLPFIRLMIQCGADINRPDKSGTNALITSVTMNRPDILEDLITLGADVNAKAASGYNALTYAAMMSSSEEGLHEDIHEDTKFNPRLVTLLMQNGSDYLDAMIIALKTSNSEFIRLLLSEGADPNIMDDNGRTPLMMAAIDEEIGQDIIDTLLEFDADINATDNKGRTALMWAVSSIDRTQNIIIPALIRTGGLRAKGWEKWFAFASLYTASRHELKRGTVRYLIEKGADTNIIDKRGMTAIMYALANGDDESADILSDAGAQINFDIT